MTVEIRTIDPAEAEAWFDSLAMAFLEPIDPRVGQEVREHWDFSRVWAAVEDGVIVGTARTWATELTLPGDVQVSAAAVSGVTVRASHRRRGILSQMLAAEHAASAERGEQVTILHAAEYPIYGRFGYGTAAPWATWTWDRRASAMRPVEDDGRIDLVTPTTATLDQVKAVFEARRLRQPGELRRREISWEWDLGLRPSVAGTPWKGWVALHRDAAGAVDGFVRYHAEAKWEQGQSRSIVHVDDLHALSPGVEVALWAFLGRMDLVATVRAERRRPSELLPWLLVNARAAVASDSGDALWVRVADLPGVLAARRWESSDSLVLEVARPDAAAGTLTRLALDATPDGATCVATTRSPDLTLPQEAVGAVVLGGTRLRDVVLATGVDEHRPGVLARADRLFATLDAPWCSTFF